MSVIADLRRQGLKVMTSAQPGELWICCPFCVNRGHTPDTEFKLGFNFRNGKAHCFRCQWASRNGHHDLGVALTDLILAQVDEEKEVKVKLPDDYEPIYEATGHWQSVARKYLTERNVSWTQIRDHEIGVSLLGRTRGRLIFPIRDASGVLLGWSARSFVGSETPKWLHSTGLRTGFWARRTGSALVLVEGIFDALAVERSFKDIAVMAMLGTNFTESKRKEFRNQFSSVVIWLDSDKAGRKGAVNLAQQLYGTVRLEYISTEHKDAGAMTQAEIEVAFQARKRWTAMSGLSTSWQD